LRVAGGTHYFVCWINRRRPSSRGRMARTSSQSWSSNASPRN